MIKKEKLYYILFLVVIIPILFILINFDRELNLDYYNYKANFENNWNQFEFAFEKLYDYISFFNKDFDFFWSTIIIIEIILIIILYNNLILFLFAVPNLFYLSATLGTQIRFALATLILLLVFKFLYNKKYFVIITLTTIMFHNANIITIVIINYIKLLFNINIQFKITFKNITYISAFVLILISVVLITSQLLKAYGYDYYVGTMYESGRSLNALIFLFIELITVTYLLNKKNYNNPTNIKFIYLGLFLLLSSIIFNNYSVISGRITIVYLLIQPFILSFFYEIAKGNRNIFFIFIIYLIFNILKVIQKFI